MINRSFHCTRRTFTNENRRNLERINHAGHCFALAEIDEILTKPWRPVVKDLSNCKTSKEILMGRDRGGGGW